MYIPPEQVRTAAFDDEVDSSAVEQLKHAASSGMAHHRPAKSVNVSEGCPWEPMHAWACKGGGPRLQAKQPTLPCVARIQYAA